MSLRSFWHKPIYGPQPPKKKKIGCLGWCGIFAGLFVIGCIVDGVEKIKSSAHPALYFTLAGIAVVALLVGAFFLLRYLINALNKKYEPEYEPEKTESCAETEQLSERPLTTNAAEKPAVVTPPPTPLAPPKKEQPYEFYRVKTVGVTFKNDDGTSRQELIRKMYYKDPPFDGKEFPLELDPYEYQGAPAFRVLFNGYQIGNLSKEDAQYFNDNMDRYVTLCGAKIVGGDTPTEDDFFRENHDESEDYDDYGGHDKHECGDYHREPLSWGFHFNIKLIKDK